MFRRKTLIAAAGEIPNAGWQKATLMTELQPLEIEKPQPLTEQQRAYCRYYGIDSAEWMPSVSHGMGALTCDEYQIASHVYRPPESRGTALIVHGYFDHVGLYKHVIRRCLEKGLAVICFDLPGHGLSSGNIAAIGHFDDYQRVLLAVIEACRGHFPEPWIGIGQSTGAAILIDHLLLGSGEVRPFVHGVFLAPLVRPCQWPKARLIHQLVHRFLTTWPRGFADNSSDPQFLTFLREQDPLQPRVISIEWVGALKEWIPRIEAAAPVAFPVTIIQGDEDKTVDWRHNLPVLQCKFPENEVVTIEHGRHHLVNDGQSVRHQLFAVIDRVIDIEVGPTGRDSQLSENTKEIKWSQ